MLRKLSLRRFESGENVEQDESGKNNRGAIGVQELDPRLAQGDHPKDHQPHRKQFQLMGVPSHWGRHLLSYGSEGNAPQEMIAEQEGKDRHWQKEQDSSGRDGRPICQA
jgi:hypothetical protein